MTRKEIVSLVILLCVISYGLFRYFNRSFSLEKSQFLMDTIVKVSATSKSKEVVKKIDLVFEYIKQLESNLTEYKPEGWLYKINNSKEIEFKMHPDAYPMFVLADSLYRMTEGRFDITIKPVFDLWHFDSNTPQVPDSMLIKATLKKVGFNKIKYTKDLLIKPAGMQITFGALAKGYIVDKAREYMKSIGIDKGYIDCHSSMTFYGNKLLPEVVGIQHPRKMNEVIATLKIENNSIGTSGDYQQYFDLYGKRYHHILNAKTGYPADSTYSVTVINPSALIADGYSTAFFLISAEKVMQLLKKIPQTQVIIYYQKNGSIVSLKSAGIKKLLINENG